MLIFYQSPDMKEISAIWGFFHYGDAEDTEGHRGEKEREYKKSDDF